MKIALVCPDDLSTLIFAPPFVKAIGAISGCDVCTISPVILGYQSELEELGCRHIALDMERFISPMADLRYLLSLYRICRREQFDLVINWTTKPNIYGPVVERLAGVRKIVCAVRGLGAGFNQSHSFKPLVMRKVLESMYRVAFRTANVAWFTNPRDLEYFATKNIVSTGKSVLTNNAIDIEKFSLEHVDLPTKARLKNELDIQDNEFVIVMVARMIWSKGIREYIEAAMLFKDSHPQVKFVLVAPLEDSRDDSVPREFIERHLGKANLKWIEFTKDIREVYSLADVAVLPSYYREGGYPRALLEPMALGKPVIAADTPDCRGPLSSGKNGILVAPQSTQALSDAIETMFQEPEKRKEYASWSRKIVEQEYDERVVARAILQRLQIVHDLGIE